MKKYIGVLISSIVIASSMTGCGSSKPVSYKDGKYKAEANKTDNYGWKSYVEIEIKDGKIANVDFDYLNKDNKRKSQDEKYNKSMKEKAGTSPKEFCSKVSKDLVEKQNLDKLDGISGATHSVNEFKTLAKAALNNAEKGNTEEATVKIK